MNSYSEDTSRSWTRPRTPPALPLRLCQAWRGRKNPHRGQPPHQPQGLPGRWPSGRPDAAGRRRGENVRCRTGRGCGKGDAVRPPLPRRQRAGHSLLRGKGHVVGFMGDGINDAPALRAADVGISVDTATDIAKESADLILLEKDLMVLEGGVIEGRKVFANIVKYIRMGASSNFGNMFSVLGASAFLPFLPMAPIQVLTNNLLYDFSQVPIPADAVDEEQVPGRGPGTSGRSGGLFSLSARSARFSTIRLSSSCSGSSTAGIHPERRCFRPDGSSNR